MDSSALSAALVADGPTVAVSAGGVDRPYPSGSESLLARVVEEGGLVLSEYPIGTMPARVRFVAFRRLVVALADATVIVEAGRRSGAYVSAAVARGLGRPVYAVPGPITSAMSTVDRTT